MPRFRAKAPKSALKKQTPDQISVKAMLRLRPLQRSEKTKGPPCIEIDNPQSVTYVHGVGRSVKKEQYTFDTVFDDTSTQSEVFNETAMPLVRDVLDGRNALLFTYAAAVAPRIWRLLAIPARQSADPAINAVVVAGMASPTRARRTRCRATRKRVASSHEASTSSSTAFTRTAPSGTRSKRPKVTALSYR